MLNDLEAVITAFIQSISSEQLIAMFRNKIRRVQACIDAKGGHFQHKNYNCHSYLPPVFYIETCMLINMEVHSDFPNTLYNFFKGWC